MDQSNKPHRTEKVRNTAKKKLHSQGHNAKAFAVSAPGKMRKQAARTSEINEKKMHVPMVDRTPDDDPPPIIVAIVGPPGTGKSTLIKSLVRRLAKTSITDIRGPITVVSGKRRRLTFIEVGNDLNSMIDMAKIADLVLLMIDCNFGLEMETMEFLNIAQHHGMPRVFGVATHLDLFKSQSTLRAAKKSLKQRIWTEVYAGAKLFYLSGVINGRYPDREILNLTRFISVMKFRPLKWRNEHPYLLVDRVTDLTHPEQIAQDPKTDRKVALYGYLHGTALPHSDARVHIAGMGDCTVSNVEKLPDPCPTPFFESKLEEIEREAAKEAAANGEAISRPRRRKRLDDRQKIVYAPMSDVHGVLIDKDAVYIDVGWKESKALVQEEEEQIAGAGDQMIAELQSAKENSSTQGLQLFSHSEKIQNESDSELEDFSDDDVEDKGRSQMRVPRTYQKEEVEMPEDSEEESENDEIRPQPSSTARKWDINKLIYMDNVDAEDVVRRWRQEEAEMEDDESNSDDEDFFKKSEGSGSRDENEQSGTDLKALEEKWTAGSTHWEKLKLRFMTNPVKTEDNNDEDVYGDFEDLENGEGESREDSAKDSDSDSGEGSANESAEEDEDDFTGFDEPAVPEGKDGLTVEQQREVNSKKKQQLRQQFEEEEHFDDPEGPNEQDTWYELQKAKMAKQLEINKAEFGGMDPETRVRIEGYKAGSYVRLTFEAIPKEFVENLDPTFPIVVGGLLATEERFGMLNVRIRRHRWHKKILKSNDPLVLSLGWRRFQTLPIYTTTDSRTRTRMLKYTPEHAYCFATFYGPLAAPNTPFCATNVVSNSATTGSFRIAATGVVEDLNNSTDIVKKLKLVGYPYKIFRNTAFIKDMFSSSIEVAKFEGASIRTVSGIRGEIKRGLSSPEGHFRATFEDKILLSDIVSLRTWYPVPVKRFYNPVTSLLMSNKTEWQGMRLTGQIRHENDMATPADPSSAYGKVQRVERRFNPLRVPKSVQSELPFKSQIHQMKPQKKTTYMAKRAVVLGGEEKKARDLMQKVATLKRSKDEKRKEQKQSKFKDRLKKMAKVEEERKDKERERKKEFFSREGKKRSIGASEASSSAFGKKARR